MKLLVSIISAACAEGFSSDMASLDVLANSDHDGMDDMDGTDGTGHGNMGEVNHGDMGSMEQDDTTQSMTTVYTTGYSTEMPTGSSRYEVKYTTTSPHADLGF